MNRIFFTQEQINIRAILGDCFINIRGESFACTIGQLDARQYLPVRYTDHGKVRELTINLYYLNAMSDPALFYFEQSDPDGAGGTLVIPTLGRVADDDDDLEDDDADG